MTCPLPRMSRPCGGPQPCPWRKDAPPGQFPPERYQALRATSRRPDEHGETDAEGEQPDGEPCDECGGTGKVTPEDPTDEQMDEWRSEVEDAVNGVLDNCPV